MSQSVGRLADQSTTSSAYPLQNPLHPYIHRNTRADPASAVFATTSREHPVHLWDAYTGQIRWVDF